MNKHYSLLGCLLLCFSIQLIAQSSIAVPSEYTATKKRTTSSIRQTSSLKIVYFGVDETEIDARSKVTLNRLYETLKNKEQYSIKIDGHSNGNCDDEFCEKLASERAEAVAFYLMEKGVRSHRIKYAGYGKQKPRSSNRTTDGKRKNQRVEIHLIKGN